MSCNRGCKGKNQRCHKDKKSANKPFCGTNKCRRKRDCKDVGYWANGQNKARICKRGRCVYKALSASLPMDMERGGFTFNFFLPVLV